MRKIRRQKSVNENTASGPKKFFDSNHSFFPILYWVINATEIWDIDGDYHRSPHVDKLHVTEDYIEATNNIRLYRASFEEREHLQRLECGVYRIVKFSKATIILEPQTNFSFPTLHIDENETEGITIDTTSISPVLGNCFALLNPLKETLNVIYVYEALSSNFAEVDIKREGRNHPLILISRYHTPAYRHVTFTAFISTIRLSISYENLASAAGLLYFLEDSDCKDALLKYLVSQHKLEAADIEDKAVVHEVKKKVLENNSRWGG